MYVLTWRLGDGLTNAVVRKDGGALQFGRDPVLGGSNLGLKEFKKG